MEKKMRRITLQKHWTSFIQCASQHRELFGFTFRCRVGHPGESIAVANDGGPRPQVLGWESPPGDWYGLIDVELEMKSVDFMNAYEYTIDSYSSS